MNWLSYIFLAGFLVGLVLTMVEYLMGANNRNPSGSESEWFSFSALLVALTWFGGAGFVLLAFNLSGWVAVPVALVVGAVGYYFTLHPLKNGATEPYPYTTHKPDKNLEGAVARVTNPVTTNEGKVVCTHDGARYQLIARSINNQTYPEGAHVVIVKSDQKMVYVEDLNKVLYAAGAEKWAIK
jgi:membrane protein implicated in regulation of membrane protease activity